MTDYVKAWQCIGCGRIEAPQTSIGVCEYRKAEFVYAFEHEQVVAQAEEARRRTDILEALVRQLARTTPRRFLADAHLPIARLWRSDSWNHGHRPWGDRS